MQLDLLARKMPSESTGAMLTGETLKEKLDEHLAAVREIYDRVVHAQKPMYYTIPPEPAAAEEEGETQAPADNLTRLLEQRAPHLAEAVASAGLHRGRERFEHFLEKSVRRRRPA